MADSKRPGRPSVADGETPARVHVTLPPRDYDKMDEIAKRDGCSVPEVIRRGVARVLSDEAND